MRTSGRGQDSMMMTVPLLILVVVGTVLLGGPREALMFVERNLEAVVQWVGDLVS